MKAPKIIAPQQATCPICRKPTATATRPFCSVRCSEIDLGRWFTESYVVPGPAPTLRDDDDDLTG
jgi:endogenous inhibitor of DNA gyrase (YacG/DUF329 family)